MNTVFFEEIAAVPGEVDDLEMLLRITENLSSRLWRMLQEDLNYWDFMGMFKVPIERSDIGLMAEGADRAARDECQRIRIKLEQPEGQRERLRLYAQMERSGLTGQDLRVKRRLLERLWEQLRLFGDKVGDAVNGVIDLTRRPAVKLLRTFLGYLNKFASSLKAVIPGIEATQELKDALEASIDVAQQAQEYAQ